MDDLISRQAAIDAVNKNRDSVFHDSVRKERRMSKLVRYRFCTRAVDDYRPLVDMKPIGMPWWCTGEGDGYVTIVCYLPEGEPLEKYWDDAFDIYEKCVDEIIYTDRFQKPEWLERSEE